MRRALPAALLVLGLLGLPAVAAEPAPPPPPAVSLASGSAGPVSTGGSLKVTVGGAARVLLVWESAGGDRVVGASDGDGTASAPLPHRFRSGRYRLQEVVLLGDDGSQGFAYLRDGRIRDGGLSTDARHVADLSVADFDLDNDAPDREAPSLTSLPTGTVHVRPGGTFAVDFGVTDGAAGRVDRVHASWLSPDTSWPFLTLRSLVGTPGTDTMRVVGELTEDAEPGRYALAGVTVTDAAGNRALYDETLRRTVPVRTPVVPHGFPVPSLVVVVDPEAPLSHEPVAPDGPVVTRPLPADAPPADTVALDPVPTAVAYGDPVVLSGRATDAGGRAAAGARVTVLGQRAGQPERELGSVLSDADGRWRWSGIPYAGLTLRAVSGTATATAAPVVLTPAVVLSSQQPAAARTSYDLVAAVAPARVGAVVQLERLLPTGTWLPVASATQDGLGRVRFSRTELLSGPVTYRAVLGAAPGYTGATGTATVDVR